MKSWQKGAWQNITSRVPLSGSQLAILRKDFSLEPDLELWGELVGRCMALGGNLVLVAGLQRNPGMGTPVCES